MTSPDQQPVAGGSGAGSTVTKIHYCCPMHADIVDDRDGLVEQSRISTAAMDRAGEKIAQLRADLEEATQRAETQAGHASALADEVIELRAERDRMQTVLEKLLDTALPATTFRMPPYLIEAIKDVLRSLSSDRA